MADTVFYRHGAHLDYIIVAPDTPTHFPGNSNHKLDVLYISLVKLPSHNIRMTNLTALSSDHNPIILIILDSLITILPPPNHFKIKWKKFERLIAKAFPIANLQVSNTYEIDTAISYLFNSTINIVEKALFHFTKNST